MNEQTISLGEFVKQLTARIQENNDLRMPLRDDKPWHMLFYRLKKDSTSGKPAFFDDLQFDWDGPYPVCQELSEYVHTLHFTGCMSAGNPSYDQITLNSGLAKKWNSVQLEGELPKFLERAMQEVRTYFRS